MDVRILDALATSALYPYLEGEDSGSDLDGTNGAEHPALVADTILGVPRPWSSPFYIGFNFALALAAVITDDPAHLPDLRMLVDDVRGDVREAWEERDKTAA